jgi:hypothetical protein
MSAKNLIALASSKGYAIGRNKPGQYRYGFHDNGTQVEKSFNGTWAQFVKFVKELPSR